MSSSEDIQLGVVPQSLWARQRPYLTISDDELAVILARIMGRSDIAARSVLNDGAFNTNLKVELNDGMTLVLRVYEQDENACLRDQKIADVIDGSLPMAKILGVGQFREWPVAVFEWIDGVYPDRAFESAQATEQSEIAEALGAVLAGISRAHRFPAHGLLDGNLDYRRRFSSNRDSFVDFIDWSLKQGRAGQRLGPELADRLASFVKEQAHLLDATEDNYRLVHGDFRPTNILMNNDGAGWYVAAVLDWEFAMAGSPLLDFGVLLRGAVWGEAFEARLARSFVEAGGELPQRWRETSQLLDLRNLCGFLNASSHRGALFAAIRQEIIRIVGD